MATEGVVGPVTQRKHTRCRQCCKHTFCRFLEVLWRWDADGPWNWICGPLCPPCRAVWVDSIMQLGDQVVAWDG